MREVFAVTTGGSTMDILGVFEDHTLAEAALADWRQNMGVYDDGWGIETLTVWDRLPTHWTSHDHHVAIDRTGEIARIQPWQHVIYEWRSDGRTPATKVDQSESRDGGIVINVTGADEADVISKRDEAVCEAQAAIRSRLKAALGRRIEWFKDSIRDLERPPSAAEDFQAYAKRLPDWNHYANRVIEAAARYNIPADQVKEIARIP